MGKAAQRPARVRSNSPAPGRPPLFAEARRFELHGAEYAVLSFPLPPDDFAQRLTATERAVTDLVLRGLSTAEIARRRRRSSRTIANQIASLFQKLGVRSRRELVSLFLERERPAIPAGAKSPA
jgi:DNA-binding CsgD family transcriptional regulator